MSIAFAQIEDVIAASPWETKPYGVVSLLEMLRFYADVFVRALSETIKWEVRCSRREATSPMLDSQVVEIGAYATMTGALLLNCGLQNSFRKCERIRLRMGQGPITCGEMESQLRELRERIEDDLQSIVLLSLSARESKIYSAPDEGWEGALGRFHQIRHDVEECSKCLALGRYVAAVFHAMLVAEFGTIKVSELFGIKDNKIGWSALDQLDRLQRKSWDDKTELEKGHDKFLKSLLPLALSIKNSWRHKITHVNNKLDWMGLDFGPEAAEEIISATRGFMRKLAADLPDYHKRVV